MEILTENLFVGNVDDYYLLSKSNNYTLFCLANNPDRYFNAKDYWINDANSLKDVNINEVSRCFSDLLSCHSPKLIFCNQGKSRSPTMGLIVLMELGMLPRDRTSVAIFTEKSYPDYAPNRGMRELINLYITKGI